MTALWQLRSPSPGEQAARPAARPQVNGEWRAEVVYDWPNAHYIERLVFSGEGDVVGAFSVTAPVTRIDKDTLVSFVPALLEATTSTSQQLGWVG